MKTRTGGVGAASKVTVADVVPFAQAPGAACTERRTGAPSGAGLVGGTPEVVLVVLEEVVGPRHRGGDAERRREGDVGGVVGVAAARGQGGDR